MAFHDSDTVQIFLHDFFPHDLNVLLGLTTGAFTQAIGGMLLHQHPDLFGDISSGGELGDTLADECAFTQVALSLAGQQFLRAGYGLRRGVLGCARRRFPLLSYV